MALTSGSQLLRRLLAAPRRQVVTWRLGAYLYVLPAAGLFLLFVVTPTLGTAYYSFFAWAGHGPMRFAGLANYQRALGDEVLQLAFLHNLIYMVVTFGVEVLFGLAMALLLNRRLPLFGLFRVLFFTPVVLSLVVVGLLWNFIYDPLLGLLNGLLQYVGLGAYTRAWLGEPQTALYAVSLTSGWVYAGFFMVIFYAALQRIPREMLEAAQVDGANEWQRTWHVTLPLLREVLVLCFLIAGTGAFKAFDLFFVMTKGGPYHASEIVPTWLVRQGFDLLNVGYGATIATLMTVVVFALALVYSLYTRRRAPVEY